jgi:hypothetical protein
MTDNWDFYFLRVDDKPASIFVDLGIAREAPIKALPFMAYVRLYMTNPRPDGLSSQEEFDALTSIEDAMKKLGGAGGEAYVGRKTNSRQRLAANMTAGKRPSSPERPNETRPLRTCVARSSP